MNKKILGMVVALMAVVILASSIVPTFAKKFPEGVKIAYYTGGEGNLVTPTGFPLPAPYLRIGALEIEASNWGSGDDIGIFFGDGTFWFPLAYFTTNQNPEYETFLKELWGNTPAGLKNTIVVSEDELKVDRHGNQITASLTEQEIQLNFGSGWEYYPISAFTMELNKVGDSIHSDYSINAPTYTINLDRMGFNGNGVFTYNAVEYPMTDEFIIMHGIETFVSVP